MPRVLITCLRTAALCCCLTFCVVPASAQPAPSFVVDRVVAVVDEHPILLSEAVQRIRQSLFSPRAESEAPKPELLQQAIEIMIDERLIEQEAERRSIEVTPEEIDRAVHAVAESNGLTTERVYQEAAKSGLDRPAYRRALASSLREQKLIHLELAPKISIDDSDVRQAYDRMLARERSKRPYRAAWIVLRVPQGASDQAIAAIKARAEQIVREARGGTPFATLARAHSDDPATKDQGGDLGRRVPAGTDGGMTLRPQLEKTALQLAVGETSDPIRLDEGFVVLHLVDRPESAPPPFDQVRESLRQQLYVEAVDRARKAWLQEVRNRSCVLLRFTPVGPKGAE